MRQAPAGTSMRRLALGASKPGAWTAKGVALPSSGSPCKHVESMLARRIPNQGDQQAQRHLQRQLHPPALPRLPDTTRLHVWRAVVPGKVLLVVGQRVAAGEGDQAVGHWKETVARHMVMGR